MAEFLTVYRVYTEPVANCPFCDSSELTVWTGRPHFIHCDGCGTDGPTIDRNARTICHSIELARALWNKRID